MAVAVGRELWSKGLLPGGALYTDLKGVRTYAAVKVKIAQALGVQQVCKFVHVQGEVLKSFLAQVARDTSTANASGKFMQSTW